MDALLTKRKQRALVIGAAAAALTYAAYQSYKSSTGQRLSKALQLYSSAFVDSAELVAGLARSAKEYINSDAEELPREWQQVLRSCSSPEASLATSKFVRGLVEAFVMGCSSESSSSAPGAPNQPSEGIVDKLLGALLSEKGHSLVSLAVSVATRSAVKAFCEQDTSSAPSPASASPGEADSVSSSYSGSVRGPGSREAVQAPQIRWLQQLLVFATSHKGERFVLECVGKFVRNGMEAYLDKIPDVSLWEDILSAAARPESRQLVESLAREVTREAVSACFPPRTATRSPVQREVARRVLVPELPIGAKTNLRWVPNGSPPVGAHMPLTHIERDPPAAVPEGPIFGVNWAKEAAEIARVPEARGLVLSMVGAGAGAGATEAVKEIVATVKGALTRSPVSDELEPNGDSSTVSMQPWPASYAIFAVLVAVLLLRLLLGPVHAALGYT